jgi:pre-mRNA-splicing factor ATP-dependent RNA helicase DHX15/PRP43
MDNKPPWIIFQDFVLTTRNFVRSCTSVRVEWLIELAPHYFDLESWPDGETKHALENSYRRLMEEYDYNAKKKRDIALALLKTMA